MCDINSFDPAARRAAIHSLLSTGTTLNLHCHSFFSYNGYGFSPSQLVALAFTEHWRAVGLVDFDVLDGVDEFLEGARLLGVRAAAGMETRVFIPELKSAEINSPGEPGIAYHLGYGFASSQVPPAARPFADRLREIGRKRVAEQLDRINALLPEIARAFDAVAAAYTPGGNVTERHLCRAYREAAEAAFPDPGARRAYWQEKIGGFEADPVALEALIRAKTMKQGGVGYVAPKPESFPTLTEMNEFVRRCGAVPTVAWLNGLSAGEADPGALLDLHMKHGAGAVTIIPERNWNVGDPAKKERLLLELDRLVMAAEARGLPILAGTEMNAPGQKLADDLQVPELRKYLEVLVKGADAFAR